MLRHSIEFRPNVEEKGREFVLVKDSLNVWMRGVVQKRSHLGRVFISYCNWGDRFDEWIDETGARMKSWQDPLDVKWNPSLISPRHVRKKHVNVLLCELLSQDPSSKNGRFQSA